MVQVIQCLLTNVLTHATGCSKVNLSCKDRGESFTITVSDNGIGLPDPISFTRIFTPFFHNRDAMRSSGLGLSIAAAFVQAHGGNIAATPRAPSGVTFTIKI